ERFENTLLRCRIHALSGVRNGEHHVRTRLEVRMPVDVDFVQLHVARFDRDTSAARHCVARIHHEVQQDLFELTRVETNAVEVVGEPKLDLDVLTHQSLQHFGCFTHHGVQVQHFWLSDLVATDGQ